MKEYAGNSIVLLLCGFLTGVVFSVIILTDMFDANLRDLEIPQSIDSGWGALAGAFLSGVFAISLFWVQRLTDIRDRRKNELRECQQLSESIQQIINRTLRHQDKSLYDEWRKKFKDKATDDSSRLNAIGIMRAHTNSMKLDVQLVQTLLSEFRVGATVSKDIISNLNTLRQSVSTFSNTLEEHYRQITVLDNRQADQINELVNFTRELQENLETVFAIAYFMR